jgi:hypothetical protein
MTRHSALPFRSCQGLALSALIAAAAAACDQPTSPAASPSASAADEEGGFVAMQKPALYSVATRYRDAGHHPATGRSGTASLSAQALLGRDGTTELRLSTGDVADPWGGAPGSIARVQTKAFTPQGELFSTINHTDATGGRASYTYRGMIRGTLVQAQAGITGVDTNRTDVVTVADTVRLRPNLRLAGLGVPSTVAANDPVNVAATIRETNGDVGNWGACTLFVDGQKADDAPRVWVDAGDVVTCAFTHAFALGEHQVQVRVDAAPGAARDDDPGDNSASATVKGVAAHTMSYWLGVSDVAQRDSSLWEERLNDGTWHRTWQESRTSLAQFDNVFFGASSPREIVGAQVGVTLQEQSGGATVTQGAYSLTLEPAGDTRCGSAADGALWVYVCSGGWIGGTSLYYERYAGRVTYHSHTYVHTWDTGTGMDYAYSFNDSGDDGGTATPFTGSDFGIHLRMYDGTQVLAADPSLELQGGESRQEWPWSCQPYFDDEYCAGGSSYSAYRWGWTESPYTS